jgi:hypothetical protein
VEKATDIDEKIEEVEVTDELKVGEGDEAAPPTTTDE